MALSEDNTAFGLGNGIASCAPERLDQLVLDARAASRFLKALSNENRLLLLCLLAEGEKSASGWNKPWTCASRRSRSSLRACAPRSS